MGYISFAKSTGDVDLVPADGIAHVSMTDADTAVIEYVLSGSQINTAAAALGARTTVEFATAWAAEGSKAATVVARIAINDAISAAAGTAGPAIPVQLQAGQYVTSAKYSYATPVS